MDTIRKMPKFISSIIEDAKEDALKFVKNKYPKVNFDNIEYIFSATGNRSRYFRNKDNCDYKNPVVFIYCDNKLWLYKKKSLGLTASGLSVGYKINITLSLIHELTHHVQYEMGLNKGELETTKNEIEALKQLDEFWYSKLEKI